MSNGLDSYKNEIKLVKIFTGTVKSPFQPLISVCKITCRYDGSLFAFMKFYLQFSSLFPQNSCSNVSIGNILQ